MLPKAFSISRWVACTRIKQWTSSAAFFSCLARAPHLPVRRAIPGGTWRQGGSYQLPPKMRCGFRLHCRSVGNGRMCSRARQSGRPQCALSSSLAPSSTRLVHTLAPARPDEDVGTASCSHPAGGERGNSGTSPGSLDSLQFSVQHICGIEAIVVNRWSCCSGSLHTGAPDKVDQQGGFTRLG